jgi:hypothetical protein
MRRRAAPYSPGEGRKPSSHQVAPAAARGRHRFRGIGQLASRTTVDLPQITPARGDGR